MSFVGNSTVLSRDASEREIAIKAAMMRADASTATPNAFVVFIQEPTENNACRAVSWRALPCQLPPGAKVIQ